MKKFMIMKSSNIADCLKIKEMRLVFVLARSDLQKRFSGSFFGIFWMLIQPIVSVIIYYWVFQLGFKSNPVESIPYVAWLLPGIVPWFYFNDAIINGITSFVVYRHWVKKLSFNISILPFVRILASLFLHIIFMVIMIVVIIIYGNAPSAWWFQGIYYIVANTILVTSIVYFLASINVFVKDIVQLINVLLQFGFWLAPIMYEQEIMPVWIQKILILNPFTYIVRGYRDTFLFKIGFWDRPIDTIRFWVMVLILVGLGMMTYKRLEDHFADVL